MAVRAARGRTQEAWRFAEGVVRDVAGRAVHVRLFDAALALASRMFVAVIPVALLVSSLLSGEHSFADRLVAGLQLTGAGRTAAQQLFATPDVVQAGMTFATCVVAVWSLMSCAGVLQRTCRSAWRIEDHASATWRADARRLQWAAGLVVFVGVAFELADLPAHGMLAVIRDVVRLLLAMTFFGWTPYVLLSRQISRRQLFPTAILCSLSLGALTACAPVYVPRVASTSATSYGLVGFDFVLLTWLFAQSFLILASGVIGAVLGDRISEPAQPPQDADGLREPAGTPS